jgi:hypothetical protein
MSAASPDNAPPRLHSSKRGSAGRPFRRRAAEAICSFVTCSRRMHNLASVLQPWFRSAGLQCSARDTHLLGVIGYADRLLQPIPMPTRLKCARRIRYFSLSLLTDQNPDLVTTLRCYVSTTPRDQSNLGLIISFHFYIRFYDNFPIQCHAYHTLARQLMDYPVLMHGNYS